MKLTQRLFCFIPKYFLEIYISEEKTEHIQNVISASLCAMGTAKVSFKFH